MPSNIVPASDLPDNIVPAGDMPGAKAPASTEAPEITQTRQQMKELGKGAVQGVLGSIGDVEKTLFPKEPNLFPSSEGVARFFKFAPSPKGTDTYRTVGEVGGALLTPGVVTKGVRAAKAIPGALDKMAETGERLVPGATKRAAQLVERIGNPANPNDIGSRIEHAIAPRLKQFETTRKIEFNNWLQRNVKPGEDISKLREDNPAFDAAFRKKYAQLSKDINEFTGSLAKRATSETGEAITLPQLAFRSRDSVEAFRRLAGNDDVVRQTAREWVARRLHDATRPAITEIKERPWNIRSIQAANAARKWLDKAESDWLHGDVLEPVRQDAEEFVKNFERVAHTQKHAAVAGGAAALGGLTEWLGGRPISRILGMGGF